MPPRTRTAKSTKSLKENIGIPSRTKLKSTIKVTKAPRKVLGDKTNSASDDNESIETPNKIAKKPSTDLKINQILHNTEVYRPRRERRVPGRFEDNQVLKNLSNSKENAIITTISSKNEKPNLKNSPPIVISSVSPFKSPLKVVDTSLVASRPRRVSRLPSKFEDHSISPSKFIPVRPSHASTPLVQKSANVVTAQQTVSHGNISVTSNTPKLEQPKSNQSNGDKKTKKESSDTNNNAPKRMLRTRKEVLTQIDVQMKKGLNKNEISIVNHFTTPEKKDTTPIQKGRNLVNKGAKKDTTSVEKGRTLAKKNTTLAKKGTTAVKKGRTPLNTGRTPVKTGPLKQTKTPVNDVARHAKKTASKTKQSPVKPSSTVENSYLSSTTKSPSKLQTEKRSVNYSPLKKSTRLQKKDFSFKILDDNKKDESNEDVYNFTFDPNEEPAPSKKKRKAVKRKPANPKPKKVTFKNNYDQNVNRALAALKNIVGKKPTPIVNSDVENKQEPKSVNINKDVKNVQVSNENFDTDKNRTATNKVVQRNVASKIIIGNTKSSNSCNNIQNKPQIQENILLTTNSVPMIKSNSSIRPEDIAADFASSPQHEIDYSPVNTPTRPNTPVTQISRISDVHHNDDPLNLKGDFSFDPNPIASSSMNTSVRHPNASPWRIEFENLPIRWHVNSYVKPNMTPAVECSFVNLEDKTKKKHVYTNLIPENTEPLPEIVQKDQPNLVQTSIISFIKEMVEKSSSKKNKGRSVTPVTASLFNEISTNSFSKDDDKVKKTTRQLFTPQKNPDKRSDMSNTDSSKDTSDDKENSKDSSRGQKRKNNEDLNVTPAKTPRKEKHDKYFGFDDSENLENVSPQKDIGRKKSLRQARARAVLRQINEQAGPTRAVIPVSVKSTRKAEVERLYDEMKSASEAPETASKDVITAAAANVDPVEELDEDSQTSVHLFEDIDIVHHLKPTRRSYGKAKKVTFIRQASTETQDSDLRPLNNSSDEEDELNDISFDPGIPFVEEERKKTKKKQTKRQKMTKKEKEEAEAWAAGFNSMCEDVEEFPLIVE